MGNKILCIEPVEPDYAMMSDLIINMGYSPIRATNDRNGIATFRDQHSDISLIILDVFPNIVNGVSTIRSLRSINGYVPIVIISAHPVPEWYRRECIDSGCKKYLSKPVSLVELMELLDTYTQQSIT